MNPPFAIETSRLQLSWLTLDDADFILELVNDPDWIRHIGDRDVTTREGAREFLRRGPLAMYRDHGFGLNRVARKGEGRAIGLCGLLHRDYLEYPEIGFAFLREYRRRGYAREAALRVLRQAFQEMKLSRIIAVITPANEASRQLLLNLGFRYREEFQRPEGSPLLHRYDIESDQKVE